jgi:hypothetical protein
MNDTFSVFVLKRWEKVTNTNLQSCRVQNRISYTSTSMLHFDRLFNQKADRVGIYTSGAGSNMCAPFQHENRLLCKHSNCTVNQADINEMAERSQGL